MTVAELKALAYDYIAEREEVQRVLDKINGTIIQRVQEERQKAMQVAGIKQAVPVEGAVMAENKKQAKKNGKENK